MARYEERNRPDDSISRQAAIDEIEYELEMINSALDSITLDFNARERLRQRRGEAREILNSIQQLPSVQLEQTTKKWILIKSRPMDEDERKEWEDIRGYKLDDDEAIIYTSLPDDGQEVLICLRSGDIRIDTFEEDFGGCYFNDYDDIENVVAWMPLPEPWRNEQ